MALGQFSPVFFSKLLQEDHVKMLFINLGFQRSLASPNPKGLKRTESESAKCPQEVSLLPGEKPEIRERPSHQPWLAIGFWHFPWPPLIWWNSMPAVMGPSTSPGSRSGLGGPG